MRNDKPVTTFYIADGDEHGLYLQARAHRQAAAEDLRVAAEREIDSGAGDLLNEFTFIDSADDWMALLTIKWTVVGNRATGKPPETVGDRPFWTPRLRKIGRDWKVDLTDELDGNLGATTARAESEAKALENITSQVKALKYQTLDQLRGALKGAAIKGTGKPM